MNYSLLFIYLVITLFSVFLISIKKFTIYSLILYSMIYAFLISTRSNLVPDTIDYITLYDNLSNFDLTKYTGRIEIGYIYLNLVFRLIQPNSTFLLFFFISLFNFWTPYISIRMIQNHSKKTLSLAYLIIIIFTSFWGFYYSAMVLRQGIAFSLGFLSIALFTERKRIVPFLIMILAILFHFSAVTLIPIFFIYFYAPRMNYYIYFLFIGFIVISYYFNLASILITSDKIIQFLEVSPLPDLSRYYYLIVYVNTNSRWYLFLLIIAFFWLSRYKYTQNSFRFFNVFIFGLLIFSLFKGISITERITDYFLFYSVYLLGTTINSLRYRPLAFLSFIVFFISNLYVVLRVIFRDF